MPLNNLIFVYGTLMRDLTSPADWIMNSYCTFLGNAFVFGSLYEINDYPGLKLDSNRLSKTYGEVYRISNPRKALNLLDKYEECSKHFSKPHEYRRIRHKVHFDNHSTPILAWVYVYQHSTFNKVLIQEGDYRSYLTRIRS